MQENNITFLTDEKEPLPNFTPTQTINSDENINFTPPQTFNSDENINFSPSEPMLFEEPVEPEDPDDKRHPAVEKIVDSTFGKALAATILSIFPVCSIVAIFLGFNSLKSINEAKSLAEKYGVGIGGKGKATKVLSMVGAIAGGAFTVYYTIWGCIILLYVLFYCLVLLSQFFAFFDNLYQSLDLFGQYIDFFNQYSNMYY